MFQPLLYIETWAGLANTREVSMTNDVGIGIVDAEVLQKLYHASLLGFGACVGRIAIGIQTTFIADTY